MTTLESRVTKELSDFLDRLLLCRKFLRHLRELFY